MAKQIHSDHGSEEPERIIEIVTQFDSSFSGDTAREQFQSSFLGWRSASNKDTDSALTNGEPRLNLSKLFRELFAVASKSLQLCIKLFNNITEVIEEAKRLRLAREASDSVRRELEPLAKSESELSAKYNAEKKRSTQWQIFWKIRRAQAAAQGLLRRIAELEKKFLYHSNAVQSKLKDAASLRAKLDDTVADLDAFCGTIRSLDLSSVERSIMDDLRATLEVSQLIAEEKRLVQGELDGIAKIIAAGRYPNDTELAGVFRRVQISSDRLRTCFAAIEAVARRHTE